jgi:hypothetical protein
MTIDVHKIPLIPFGLLDEEDRNVLENYLRNGGHVQRYNDQGRWESVLWPGAALHEHLTYRAASEPQRHIFCTLEGVSIWDMFDESVVALARDRDSGLYAYTNVPGLIGTSWDGATPIRIDPLLTAIDPGSMPWDKSLIVRPGWEGE